MKAKPTAVAMLATLVLGLAGCGGTSPTAEGSAAGGAAGGGGDSTSALKKVYAELEGLEGEARLKRLEELASEEDGSLTFYTSMNTEDSLPVTDAFTEKYDIDVDLYRASSSDVLTRVLQEAQADFAGADVVALNGPEMEILDQKKLLLPLDTPIRQEIFPDARYDTWLGLYLNMFIAAWNTDTVSASQAPGSWEEMLTNHPGELAMEAGDWDWMAALVEEHFMADKGMTEDEAVDLFRQAAREATVVDGHTTMAKLLAAGEYDVAASIYQHEALQLEEEGAPVEWETPLQPIILRPNGIGVSSDTDVPASSLLYLEYCITEGQQHIADIHRMPANTGYGDLTEMVEKYDVRTVDLPHLTATRAKWEKLYEEIISGSGGEVIEGE